MTIPVNIIETKTNEIDEATNGLQFSTNSFITIVLFRIIVVVSPIISSHSSVVNFAAFFVLTFTITNFPNKIIITFFVN